MPPAPLIAIVQHQAECPAAFLADWLDDAGARLVTVRPDLGARLPAVDELQGLVVLGGVMGATDDELAPWLPQVRELIRCAAAAGLPTLGVCLGHQLAAAALGGQVTRNPHGRQRGLLPIGYRSAADGDPLFGSLGRTVRGVHSNNDVVTRLPGDAVVLADAPGGEVQAARFAPTVWGVQWHPEVDADVFAGWCEIEPAATEQQTRDQIAEVASARDELDRSWQPLAECFVRLCREGASIG
ncbi:type 1 glutamine amidotransferase [Micropruina sp.]|uniref:type 1 glutamine amidotransferase n=1 Tax=Micropruina sp. TaxID=2737536 RepID=UPI0039E5A12C